jgi:hypothetical protein
MTMTAPEKKTIDQQLDELSKKMGGGFARVDKQMNERFARVDNQMNRGFARLDEKFDDLKARVDNLDEKFDAKFERLYLGLLVFAGGIVAASIATPF